MCVVDLYECHYNIACGRLMDSVLALKALIFTHKETIHVGHALLTLGLKK